MTVIGVFISNIRVNELRNITMLKLNVNLELLYILQDNE